MQPIKITVNATRAVCTERPDPITTGMVGLRAEFTFSADWDGLQKTAVCVGSGVTRDVLDVQDAITVPHECLTDPASDLKIGLYGTNSTGDIVIPTIYAYCGRLFRGADPSGDESADPTLPIWAQLQAMIGDLSNLTTTARDNLVAAINEAAKSGGGGSGTAADVRMQVAGGYIQYSTDGGTTWRNLIAMKDLIGREGIGIRSVEQTTTSTEDGGTNVVTVTRTDGTTSTFQVKNGSRGQDATVDATLTQSGKAADAAVVGQNFSELSEEIAAIPSGADGKSAYQYAQDGGYTGTETEFAAKLAQEKFANPNALTFTGAVTGSYDGSKPVSVEIPSVGGEDELPIIQEYTIEGNETASIVFTGLPNISEFLLEIVWKWQSTAVSGVVRVSFSETLSGYKHRVGRISSVSTGSDTKIIIRGRPITKNGNIVVLSAVAETSRDVNESLSVSVLTSTRVISVWWADSGKYFPAGTTVSLRGK